MSNDVNINVKHVTRVEGHGNIVLNIKKGNIEKLEWQISEAPRFFESMLRERNYDELRSIASRICGICSIGHSLASLKATEDALGITISEQTGILRRLAINGENMQSHILHVGYLAIPDLFSVGSVFPLVQSGHKDTVKKIVHLHRLSNYMCDLICGRTTHPIRLVVGGFSALPKENQLVDLKKRLQQDITIAKEVSEAICGASEEFPKFSRETEYIALSSKKEYALYDGVISSTDTGESPDYKNYQNIMKEFFVSYSTALHAKHARDSYMVGALARFNINSKQLHREAQEIANLFSLKAISYNPFMNTIAQMIEFVHNMEDSVKLIDQLLDKGIKNEKPQEIRLRSGRGVGIVEVPRGILVHDYTLNDKGKCVNANCIIPTNQNNANIQKDMESFVPQIIDKPQKEIELNLEMLVRAYDPCISCSTHYLNLTFV